VPMTSPPMPRPSSRRTTISTRDRSRIPQTTTARSVSTRA
jgi:hypothetical protein